MAQSALPIAWIVYGAKNKVLRRVVMQDGGGAPDRVPGEAVVRLGPLAIPTSLSDALAAIPGATLGRCAVVINGAVNHILCADPALDSVPVGTLVLSDLAQPGDLYANGAFQRRFVTVQDGLVVGAQYMDVATQATATVIPSLTLEPGDRLPVRAKAGP
jgi:hypothetical protein